MILSYQLKTTNDLLTSRAGLLAAAQIMDTLRLEERIDRHLPAPSSNREYQPSAFIKTFILMQHEGSFHLDDIRHIQDDEALRTVLAIDKLPKATTLGEWVRRLGGQSQIRDAWVEVNQALLQSALHRRKQVTLDIDATEIVAHKADAAWTYNKHKGFMPMVGHIAETGQGLSDSQIVHWHNQRAEDSANRIKELKLDFGGDTLPCSDFHANALYFLISALSYNVFALMRQLLPEELAQHRVMTLRWRLATKVVKTGRPLFVKLRGKQQTLLAQVLLALKEFEPPPI